MNKIIITTDLSEQRKQVIDFGVSLAQKMKAVVELLVVVNKNIDYMPVDIGMNFTDQWEARAYQAKMALAPVPESYPDVTIEPVVFIGDPKEDIIRYAVETKACIIVVGTHGRTGFSHAMMGSTAEYIVRHSPIPVLVVPMKNYNH